MELKVYEPFSPTIMEAEIGAGDIYRYLDCLRASDTDWSDQLAGKITDQKYIDPLELSTLLEASMTYVKYMSDNGRCSKSYTGGKITTSWANVQYAGEYNPRHHHTGDVSGVLFLALPQFYTNEVAKERLEHEPTRGMLQLMYGEKQEYRVQSVMFEPTVGKLILFPSYMWHQVYPFYCDGERVSLAFNMETFNEQSTL